MVLNLGFFLLELHYALSEVPILVAEEIEVPHSHREVSLEFANSVSEVAVLFLFGLRLGLQLPKLRLQVSDERIEMGSFLLAGG